MLWFRHIGDQSRMRHACAEHQRIHMMMHGENLFAHCLNSAAIRQIAANCMNVATLSAKLLGICDGEIIIPMEENSESLNAAVAASVLMWEMRR